MNIEIVSCPIVRDRSGLAESSRNKRLSESQKQTAAEIRQTLLQSKEMAHNKSVDEVEEWVVNRLNSFDDIQVEYFEIVNADTLISIDTWNDLNDKIGCIAAWVGEVRLIDNIKY